MLYQAVNTASWSCRWCSGMSRCLLKRELRNDDEAATLRRATPLRLHLDTRHSMKTTENRSYSSTYMFWIWKSGVRIIWQKVHEWKGLQAWLNQTNKTKLKIRLAISLSKRDPLLYSILRNIGAKSSSWWLRYWKYFQVGWLSKRTCQSCHSDATIWGRKE